MQRRERMLPAPSGSTTRSSTTNPVIRSALLHFQLPLGLAFRRGLDIGKAGNVRTQTLRAFSAAEMKAILAKES